MASNRVIGNKRQMPWHIPGELARFKKITMGHTIVMGRKTFESIGRPLQGRKNLILTRKPDYQPTGTTVIGNITEAFKHNPSGENEIFVIGGSQIYSLTLPLARKLYCSQLEKDYEGDVFMPDFEETDYHVRFCEDVCSTQNYCFKILARRNPPKF